MIVMEAQDRASVPIDELIEKIKSLTSSMDDAAAKISVAGDKIDETMAKTAAESRVSADAIKDSMDKNTDSTNELTDALKKTAETLDPVSSKMKIMALGVTALTGPISGLLALSPIALFGGMAIGVSKYADSLKQAQQQGEALTATQKKLLPVITELNKDFTPAAKAAQGVLGQLLATFQRMNPVFEQAGQALGPIITVLGSGVNGFIERLLDPLSNMLTNLLPLATVLAHGLNTLGDALAGLLQNLNLNAAVQGLNALFNTVGMLLPVIGQLLNVLAPIGNIILSVLVPAIGGALSKVLNALVPVFVALAPVISQFAGVFGELITTFGDLLTAAAPLIPVILKMFTAFDNLDTLFEALDPLFNALAKALGPIIDLVVKIAGVVVGALNSALTQLAIALTPLIPVLGELADSILGALLDVVRALEPAIKPIVSAFLSMLPIVGQLAKVAVELVKEGLVPMIGFFGKLLIACLPLLPPLTQLVQAILEAFIKHLNVLMPAVQQMTNAFIQLLPSLQQLIPPMTQCIEASIKLVPAVTPLILLFDRLAVKLAGPTATALVLIIGFLIRLVAWIQEHAYPVFNLFITSISIGIGAVTRILNGIITFLEGIFTGNWSKVWKGILGIFGGWVSGMTAPIQAVIKNIGGIPNKIIILFANSASWLVQAGKNIINGLWTGIKDSSGGLLADVASLGSHIVSTFTSFFHIRSPSKLMADAVGQYIPAGIAQGILANLGVIQSAVAKAGTVTVSAAKSAITTGSSTVAATTRNNQAGGSVYIDLRGSQMMTEKDMDLLVGKLGRAVATRILPQGGLRVVMK